MHYIASQDFHISWTPTFLTLIAQALLVTEDETVMMYAGLNRIPKKCQK